MIFHQLQDFEIGTKERLLKSCENEDERTNKK